MDLAAASRHCASNMTLERFLPQLLSVLDRISWFAVLCCADYDPSSQQHLTHVPIVH